MLVERQYKIRLDTFNFIKGILIILIVLGHKLPHYDIESNALFKILILPPCLGLNGCNPAFFIIAGFLFRVMPNIKCLKKTSSDLLKPFLCVMVAYAVCFPVFHYAAFRWWPGAIYESTRFFLAFLLGLPKSGKIFLGYELYECSVVWFILALFIAQNVLNLILNIKKEFAQPVLVLLCMVVGYLLIKLEFNYYCLPQGMIGVGYCYAGYLIKKTKLYNSKYLPVILSVLSVIFVVQLVWGGFSMTAGFAKFGFLDVILAGCSGALFLFLGIIVGNMEWKILEPIKTIGVYTYWLICIHSVEMSCVPWYHWSGMMKEHQILFFFIELIIFCLISIAGCTLLKTISKQKYKRRCLKKV